MIGCAYGLDSPAAVYNIVEELKKLEIKTDFDFNDGADIINRIIQGVTNDTRWLPPEQMVEKSVDVVPGELYRQWFANFSEKVQGKMVADWGEPLGEFMACGDKLAVSGILNRRLAYLGGEN
jgi:cobaltochelatase CobN